MTLPLNRWQAVISSMSRLERLLREGTPCAEGGLSDRSLMTIQLRKVLGKRLSKHIVLMKCGVLSIALMPCPPCPFKGKMHLKGKRGKVTVSCLAGNAIQMKTLS